MESMVSGVESSVRRSLCDTNFAKRNGIHRSVIYDRLRRGWTIEEIVATPVGEKRKTLKK